MLIQQEKMGRAEFVNCAHAHHDTEQSDECFTAPQGQQKVRQCLVP